MTLTTGDDQVVRPERVHVHVPVPQPQSEEWPPPPPVAYPKPRRRRRWPWVVAVLMVVLASFGVGAFVYANSLFGNVDRIDLDAVLSPPGQGTNYLIVGTDSRDGIGTDTANADVIIGEPVAGERTDTIVVLRMTEEGNSMMALPRDLWMGDRRINAAFNGGGPEALVATVTDNLGIPIHHYMEVDLAGFLGVVDAIGGITIPFEHPASDPKSGLDVQQIGDVHLDADQALAYVRSRSYTEVIDGRRVTDPTADLGRVARQQIFLQAVFDKVGGTRNPVTLVDILDGLAGNFRMDDNIGFWDAFSLARKLDGLNPTTVVLPVYGFTTGGGASVLGLDDANGAGAVLDQFRS